MLAILALTARALIQGTITIEPGKTKVQQTGVTYTFDLSCSNSFQQNGQLIIIFPADFTFTSASTLSCTDTTSGVTYSCTFNYQARLLKLLFGSSFYTQNSVSFKVTGITNPLYAVQTGYFEIRSYQFSSGNYVFLEPSVDTLKVTPTPGSLSSITYTPTDKSVGVSTTLTIKMTLEHSLPSDGTLIITFPKWNSFASQQSLVQSYVQAATSPGYVTCTPVSGFTTSKLTCLFTQGTSSDQIVVTMGSDATQISAGASLSLSINNVRTPPSQQAVTTGFVIQTTSSASFAIDQSSSGSISYQATQAATLPTSYVKITAANSKINTLTALTLQIKNVNPLNTNSNLRVIFPKEFSIASLTAVTGSGGTVTTNPSFTTTISGTTYQVDISKINNAYIEPLSYIYFTFSQVLTPQSTRDTSSFTVSLLDSSMNLIETQASSLYFRATPGTFSSASITPSNAYIYSQNVQYKFSFAPQDSFTSSALLKIVFPDQITISNRQSTYLTSYNSHISSGARVTVTSNKYVAITNPFSRSYSAGSGNIEITLDGISNAQSIVASDSFQLSIYYVDGVDIVDQVTSGLTVSLQVNPNIKFSVNMLSMETGFNNKLQFIVDTGSLQVTKGSYLQVKIPPNFEIYSTTISASTCIKIEGFSDEVTCSYTQVNYSGYYLQVKNGFDSKTFSGGRISFNISEVRNPKNSQETKSFGLAVFDSTGNMQYQYPYDVTFMMRPSAFQYSLVTSDSPVNGQSALYTFTLTFSVDTEVNAVILIYPPDEIAYDTTKNFTCKGLVNMPSQLICSKKNNKFFSVNVWSDKRSVGSITNGTSVSFQVGNFINPKSFKQSASFIIQTYIMSDSNTNQYLINQETSSLTIQNTIKGSISNLQVSQTGSAELNAETALTFSFDSQNSMSSGSRIVLTLPSNLGIPNTQADFGVTLNGQAASATFSASSNQLSFSLNQDSVSRFTAVISKGLVNPTTGPYSYSNFRIDIMTGDGYSIDSITSNSSAFIEGKCQNNCSTCSGQLASCTSCSLSSTSSTAFYLSNQQCLSECPSGYYSDSSAFKCLPCQYPCQECKYGSSLCTKCYNNHSKPYAFEQTLTCYDECPTGTFLDNVAGLCIQCKTPCYTCLSQDKCLSCQQVNNKFVNFLASSNKCMESCPDGTVSTSSSQCISCTSPCKNCKEEPGQCTSCINGYFLYRGSVCVETCPKSYQTNKESMTCDYIGEIAFPAPFSIAVAVISLGLLIARFMKNQTRLFITLLAFTDVVLKLNWIFLLIFLFAGSYTVSGAIIAYCLFATLATNLVIWRFQIQRTGILGDPSFVKYREKYPWTSRLLILSSYIISFHIFRLCYSRFFGKNNFNAQFKEHQQTLFKVIGRTTVFAVFFLCFPAVAANSYNLYFVSSSEQVFYFDIDGLVIVVYECILIAIVMTQREKLAGDSAFNIKGMLDDIVKSGDAGNNRPQTQVEELIARMKRHEIAEKHFARNDLNEPCNTPSGLGEGNEEHDLQQVTDQYAKQIFSNLFRRFQSQRSGGSEDDLSAGGSRHPYYSNSVGFLDPKEYSYLKKTLKQLELTIHNMKGRVDKEHHLKENLSAQLLQIQNENEDLLTEEEKLKREVDEIKENLAEFKRITQKELEESEALRRDQIKHKEKIHKLKQFITNAVHSKGRQIARRQLSQDFQDQRMTGEEEAAKTYDKPTLSSMLRESSAADNKNKSPTSGSPSKKQTKKKKKKRDKTLSPHMAKPPIFREPKVRSTTPSQGPKFISNRNYGPYQEGSLPTNFFNQQRAGLRTQGIQSTAFSPEKLMNRTMGAREGPIIPLISDEAGERWVLPDEDITLSQNVIQKSQVQPSQDQDEDETPEHE